MLGAAGAVQGVLAGWADQNGPLPVLVALAVFAGRTVLLTCARRRRRTHSPR